MIPDEAVEVAAREIVRRVVGRAWDSILPSRQDWYKTQARAAIEGVAPHIAAQALREASDAYPLETAYGGAEHAVMWLKERSEDMGRL